MSITDAHLTPMAHPAQNRCFGCGTANPIGLHLEFLLAEDGTVVCRKVVADTFEGPPGYVHGGMIATMLDETMSKTVRAQGVTAMTRKLEVEYLRPVQTGKEICLEGRLTHKEGRKHWTEAKLMHADGTVLAHGKGLFIEVNVAG